MTTMLFSSLTIVCLFIVANQAKQYITLIIASCDVDGVLAIYLLMYRHVPTLTSFHAVK